MKYIGIDFHKAQSTICVLDSDGKRVLLKTIHGPWLKVLDELKKLSGQLSVCYEASSGYGYLYEQLKKITVSVLVAHPGHLRLIFRSKK